MKTSYQLEENFHGKMYSDKPVERIYNSPLKWKSDKINNKGRIWTRKAINTLSESDPASAIRYYINDLDKYISKV